MNRIATWTGLAYFWKRLRSRRHFWAWLVLINVVSMALLAGLFFWMHQRASARAAATAAAARAQPHGEPRPGAALP